MVWTSSSQFILLGWFVLVVMNRSKKAVGNRLFSDWIHQGITPQNHETKRTHSFPFSLWVRAFFFQMLRWDFGSTRWFWFQSMHQNSTSSTLKEVQLIPNWQLRNEKWKQSGSLGYIGDYTTQLFRGYNKPLKGPPLNNQLYWKVIVFCTFLIFRGSIGKQNGSTGPRLEQMWKWESNPSIGLLASNSPQISRESMELMVSKTAEPRQYLDFCCATFKYCKALWCSKTYFGD